MRKTITLGLESQVEAGTFSTGKLEENQIWKKMVTGDILGVLKCIQLEKADYSLLSHWSPKYVDTPTLLFCRNRKVWCLESSNPVPVTAGATVSSPAKSQ